MFAFLLFLYGVLIIALISTAIECSKIKKEKDYFRDLLFYSRKTHTKTKEKLTNYRKYSKDLETLLLE